MDEYTGIKWGDDEHRLLSEICRLGVASPVELSLATGDLDGELVAQLFDLQQEGLIVSVPTTKYFSATGSGIAEAYLHEALHTAKGIVYKNRLCRFKTFHFKQKCAFGRKNVFG